MKLSLTILLLLPLSLLGQTQQLDTVHLTHYTVIYSQQYLQPVEVNYTVACPEPRKEKCPNNWSTKISNAHNITTSNNDDYYKNIWDRGHMAPKASIDCSCELTQETYTFLNCALQHEKLNRAPSPWYQLEELERELASQGEAVHVTVNVIFSPDSLPTRRNGPTIPTAFCKTVITPTDTTNYYFPNSPPSSDNLADFEE